MRVQRDEVIKAILYGLGAVGVFTVALMAPNALSIFAPFYKSPKLLTKKQFKRTLGLLERNRLIGTSKEGDKTIVYLTKKGKQKILKFRMDDMKIKVPEHWDKKWRLVIFDIPKQFHLARVAFARKLKEIGFVLLQKSVWAIPYPCEDEVDFLKEIYNIGQFVRVVTADRIDIEYDLIRKFSIKR